MTKGASTGSEFQDSASHLHENRNSGNQDEASFEQALRLQVQKLEPERNQRPHPGARRKRRPRRGGMQYRKEDPSLNIFYANVTEMTEVATNILAARNEHIVGAVETHFQGTKARKMFKIMEKNGWTVSHAPATPTGNGECTHGGTLLLQKPWLRTVPPEAATGKNAETLPADDLVWKHVRLIGLHVAIIFCYYDDTIGLAGANMKKCRLIDAIRDEGNRKIICIGDFNCSPETWVESGLLQKMRLTDGTAGDEHTCMTSGKAGASLLDYMLIDDDTRGLVKTFTVEHEVLWAPHYAFRLALRRRPERVQIQKIARATPFPTPPKNDKGEYKRWDVNDNDWQEAHRQQRHKAQHDIDKLCRQDHPLGPTPNLLETTLHSFRNSTTYVTCNGPLLLNNLFFRFAAIQVMSLRRIATPTRNTTPANNKRSIHLDAVGCLLLCALRLVTNHRIPQSSTTCGKCQTRPYLDQTCIQPRGPRLMQ